MGMICKNCGSVLAEGARFCAECGAVVEQAQSAAFSMQVPGAEGQAGTKKPMERKAVRCAGCGAELREGAEFCLYCGRKNCATIPAWVILLAVSMAAVIVFLIRIILVIILVLSECIGVWGVYCSLLLLGIYCLKTREAVFLSIFAGLAYGGLNGIFTWWICETDSGIQGIPRKYMLGCLLLAVGALVVWSMTVKLIQAKARQGSYLFLLGVMGTVPLMQLIIWKMEALLAGICSWQESWLSLLEISSDGSGLIFIIIEQMICSGVVTMVYLKKIGSDFRLKVTCRIR